jgi:hypothetical protein
MPPAATAPISVHLSSEHSKRSIALTTLTVLVTAAEPRPVFVSRCGARVCPVNRLGAEKKTSSARNLAPTLGQYPCEQPHIYEKESESEIWHFQPTGPDRVLALRDRDPIGSRESFAESTKSSRSNDIRRANLCHYHHTEDRWDRHRRLLFTGSDLFRRSPRQPGWRGAWHRH